MHIHTSTPRVRPRLACPHGISWPICFLLISAFLSGFGIQVVGTLFIGDFLVALLAIFYLVIYLNNMVQVRRLDVLLLGMALVALFVVFDATKAIPNDDLMRGAARNGIFVLSIIAGLFLFERAGPRISILTCLIMMFAPALTQLYYEHGITDIITLVKYSGAGTLLYITVLFLPTLFLQYVAMLGSAAILGLLLDTRSGAAGCVCCVLIVGFRRAVEKLRLTGFVVAGSVAAFVMVPVVISLLTSVSETSRSKSRHELSNEQRFTMAQDAFDGFRKSPYIGNGSWQHARTYMDTTIQDKFVGVHSWVLQLAYEYGVIGLVTGVFLGVLGLAGIWLFCWGLNREVFSSGVCFIGVLLSIGVTYSSMFSPFAGPSRIHNGLTCGYILSLLAFYGKQRSITKFKKA